MPIFSGDMTIKLELLNIITFDSNYYAQIIILSAV